MSPEEEAVFDFVTTLIEQFEERAYPIPDAPPHEEQQAKRLGNKFGVSAAALI